MVSYHPTADSTQRFGILEGSQAYRCGRRNKRITAVFVFYIGNVH